jgi:predicted nucleic acid-binding Zn ribbon protein
MIYQYKCNTCDKVFDVDLDPRDPFPKEIPCKDEVCKGKMARVWKLNAVIPEHMKATSDNSINYEKRSQVHKKHFGKYGRF